MSDAAEEAACTRNTLNTQSRIYGEYGRGNRAAVLDALMQGDGAARIRDAILMPLQAEAADRATARVEKAAATRVEFFTLMRGED